MVFVHILDGVFGLWIENNDTKMKTRRKQIQQQGNNTSRAAAELEE